MLRSPRWVKLCIYPSVGCFSFCQDLRTVRVMLCDGLFWVFSGDQGDTILVVTITALSHKIQSSIWLLCSRKKWQYGIWRPSWRNLKANLKKGKPHFRNQSERFIWEHLGVGILSGFTHFLINKVSIKKFEIWLVWLGCFQSFRFPSVLRGCKTMSLFINILVLLSFLEPSQ